jgi:hypothetical protein
MGRQVNFFLFEDDEARVLERIGHSGEFVLFRTVSKVRPRPIPLPLRAATGSTSGFDLALVIVPRAPRPRLRIKFVETVRDYVVDKTDSEVIEFRRSQLIDGPTPRYGPAPATPWIESGRLWFDPLDHGGRPKSPQFVSWADGVLRRVRRALICLERRLYLGPGAARAVKAKRVKLPY